MHNSTDKLMNDLRLVVTDAEDLLKITASNTGEQMERVRARAQESLLQARASLREAGAELDGHVHEHPWTAVGIAAGLGLALGVLLSRR